LLAAVGGDGDKRGGGSIRDAAAHAVQQVEGTVERLEEAH